MRIHPFPLIVFSMMTLGYPALGADFAPIPHNQPGLVVDLGVGLWALPLPMDHDGDGDFDMVVSTHNKPTGGVFLFRNNQGNVRFPVFEPAERLGDPDPHVTISYLPQGPLVLTPGWRHPEFLKRALGGEKAAIPFEPPFYSGRDNQWKILDFDGDGTLDLVVGASDWREYGWDDAYDKDGNWTHGPLHAHVYFMKNLGSDNEPKYAETVQLQAGDKPLDVYGCPSPNFADWDGDGDLDLICGEFLDRMTWFENIGTRQAPKYAEGRFLQRDGQDIRMELQMIQVVAFDWDRDGDVDLVVGQEDGRVALLENEGSHENGMPRFKLPVFFRQKADLLKCGALVTPCSVDWDADGDEDLICGDTAGFLSRIENLDGGNPPQWGVPKRLEAGGEVIRIQAGPNGSIQGPAEAKWGYTVPVAADWDGDGLSDVMINSIWGEILWCRNIGSRTQPQLATAERVEVEWDGKPPKPEWTWWEPRGKQLVTQWRTTPLMYDLNQDGLLDLVMLDHEGYLAFFQRERRDGGLALLPGKRIFKDKSGNPLRMNEKRAGKSGRRKILLIDWDRDGRLDLLANGLNIDFHRNVGEAGEFRFADPTPLGQRLLAGHSTCPTLVDWDRDGVRDLLVGAEDGYFYYLKNTAGE